MERCYVEGCGEEGIYEGLVLTAGLPCKSTGVIQSAGRMELFCEEHGGPVQPTFSFGEKELENE